MTSVSFRVRVIRGRLVIFFGDEPEVVGVVAPCPRCGAHVLREEG